MPEIFQALPGLEVPVDAIARGVAQLWADRAARGQPAPGAVDATATQVNFVLHFGLDATPDDAGVQFATVVRFSRRYPGRVVVLCPRHADVPAPEIKAKVHGECFLGRSKAEQRCVEFVLLSYSRSARPFLENQVSTCLSADLPLYYWAHRFAASGRLADYRYLLGRARRVLFDSAVAPADALTYPWPNPEATRDLAYCRLLPVRQSIGQFLSAYPANRLVADLRAVTVASGGGLEAEGRVLLAWLRRRLGDCGAAATTVAFAAVADAAGAPRRLGVSFDYAGSARFFRWAGDFATGLARCEADLGGGVTRLSAAASLLLPENALGEAMFFD